MIIKVGDKVKVIHSSRSKYMNTDFISFIDSNKHKTFIVDRIIDNKILLKKVSFWITEEFLEKEENKNV